MSRIGERIAAEWPQARRGAAQDGIESARVEPHELRSFCAWLQQQGFLRFLDCSVVDEPARADRFELQVLLYSLQDRAWFRVKARTAGEVPSLTPVFAAADWYEREAYDLFGVRFAGHPDLRRILLPDDAVGHPLRRDQPLGDEPVDFTVTRESHGD